MTSLVLLILAPVFPFESPLLSSPPTTTLTDGTQEAFDDGLPCRTAFFGGLSRHNKPVAPVAYQVVVTLEYCY